MKEPLIGLLLLAGLLATAPHNALAQGRGHGRHRDHDRGWEDRHDRRDRDDVVFRDQRGRIVLDDVFGRVLGGDRFDRRRGRGPAFCRSGAGHPVWGRRWCLEKGFGLGERDGIFGRRTDRRGPIVLDRDGGIVIDRDGDVILRPRRFFR